MVRMAVGFAVTVVEVEVADNSIDDVGMALTADEAAGGGAEMGS